MTATLALTRPWRLADAGRPYQVVLDGEAAGEIRNNSRVEVPVAAGEHTLQVRLLGVVSRHPCRGSPEVSFKAGDGDTAAFSCHPPRYPQAPFSWMASLAGDADRWIQLGQAP